MRKAAQKTKESQALTNSFFLQDNSMPIIDDNTNNLTFSKSDFAVNQQLLLLQQSNWFKTPIYQPSQPSCQLPNVNDVLLKQWKADLKSQEASSIQKRRIQTDIQHPTNITDFVPPTEHANVGDPQKDISSICAETDAPKLNTPQQTANMDPETVINRIGSEFQLNSKQWVAFRIIAHSFIKIHLNMLEKPEPMMTGPAGTGKTHVVNAVRALMAEYGDEHSLQTLAPTGTAASLIDGMTIHKGLGIKIKSSQKGKGN
jgi:hypothetical protein